MDLLAIFSVYPSSHFAAARVQVATMALASATSDAMAADAYSVSTLDPAATQASYVAPARVR